MTSFSSKSEVALNQSTDGNDVTFMGYVAPVAAIDVSNSNTPGAVDPTNSAGTTAYYRAVADVNRAGQFQFTKTNAYSGNNGRAAFLNSSNDSFYTVGNAGNGANPEPPGVVDGAGSQIMALSSLPESEQTRVPHPPRQFQRDPAGTGGRQVRQGQQLPGPDGQQRRHLHDQRQWRATALTRSTSWTPTGTACPPGRSRGPVRRGATLPSASTWISPTFSTSDPALGLTPKNPGLSPTNMCILAGFPHHERQGGQRLQPLPLRHLVRQPRHALRGRRGSRRRYLLERYVHGGGCARPPPAFRSGCSTALSGTLPTPSSPA